MVLRGMRERVCQTRGSLDVLRLQGVQVVDIPDSEVAKMGLLQM